MKSATNAKPTRLAGGVGFSDFLNSRIDLPILPRKSAKRSNKGARQQPLSVDRLLARAIALACNGHDYAREITLARKLAALEEAAERAERRAAA